MAEKIDYSTLRTYDKVLIYGAGKIGTNFLYSLHTFGFDKAKIIVWDINYKEIKDKFGFIVSKPDFEHFNINDNAIVIIALGNELVNEIRQQFIKAGFKNIIASKDTIPKKFKINEFVNEAYTDCSYQNDMDFSKSTPLVKPIAFYLPQFHEIPENNEWWGKGFTEWLNTSKAEPKFQGHYQPREPHDDFGYYDLSDVNTIRKQAKLAKKHGIYGWCMYYYWFSGKKLLEKPIDLLLENKDIDINFCLMWCNASWTKSWVGNDKEKLIECEYQNDDPKKFINDLEKYIDDKRYIRFNGKPLIIIYLVRDITNIEDIVCRWRKHALDIGIGEIAVFSAYRIEDSKIRDCLDGEINFSPVIHAYNAIQLETERGLIESGRLCSYAECLGNYIRFIEASKHKTFLSCMCGWDNTPRYDKGYFIFDLNFSAKLFYDMVKYVTDEAVKYNKEFIFVFAWNEWAEGAYLEPDKRFGYAMINTFSKAICGLPLDFSYC
jgi:hypothetical protein